MCAGKELTEERLADAEVARGFVSEGEPFEDVVVGVCLLSRLSLCHFGEFGGEMREPSRVMASKANSDLRTRAILYASRDQYEEADYIGRKHWLDRYARNSAGLR